MEIDYSLTEDDFITFQMYSSGESAQQRKKRRRRRFLVPILYSLIAVYFFSSQEPVIAGFFLAFSAVWLFLFPVYSRWQHRRYFRAYIKENYRSKIDGKTILRLEDEGLHSSGCDSEGTLKYSGVDELIELESLYLIRLKQAMTLLLPRERIEATQLDEFMKEVSTRTGLEIKDHKARCWK